jgi:hypothetical protein
MAAFALQTRRAIKEDPDFQLNYLENDCSTNLALDLLDELQLDEAQRELRREIPVPTERALPIVSTSLLPEIQSLVPYTSSLTPIPITSTVTRKARSEAPRGKPRAATLLANYS